MLGRTGSFSVCADWKRRLGTRFYQESARAKNGKRQFSSECARLIGSYRSFPCVTPFRLGLVAWTRRRLVRSAGRRDSFGVAGRGRVVVRELVWPYVTEHSGGGPSDTGRRRLSMPVTRPERGKARNDSAISRSFGPVFRHGVWVCSCRGAG